MEFDYTGLVNQNEFYLDHYWHAHLPEKIREASGWCQGTCNGIPAGPYGLPAGDPTDRQEIHRALVRRLLQLTSTFKIHRPVESSIRMHALRI